MKIIIMLRDIVGAVFFAAASILGMCVALFGVICAINLVRLAIGALFLCVLCLPLKAAEKTPIQQAALNYEATARASDKEVLVELQTLATATRRLSDKVVARVTEAAAPAVEVAKAETPELMNAAAAMNAAQAKMTARFLAGLSRAADAVK